MRKQIFFIGLGIFFLFISNYNTIAQTPPTKYNENQKESDEVKFAVKTNIMSIVSGELPLSFEYKFVKYFGVEAGVGLLLPYYVNLDLFSFSKRNRPDDFVHFTNKKLGYSLLFALNVYPFIGDWGHIFINPYVHFRHYSTVNVLNCGLEGGYGVLLFGALSLGVGTRIYWKHQKSLDETGTQFYPSSALSLMNFDATLVLKIGYAF